MNRPLTTLAALLICASTADAQVLYGPAAIKGGTIDGVTITNSNVTGLSLSGSNASGANVTATGSTTARTQADRVAAIVDVRDFGATGDGVTDDTTAVTAAITRANALSLLGAGQGSVLYFPPGTYYLNSTALPQFRGGVRVRGEGRYKSSILLGTAYAGDVFSWSESWYGTNTPAGQFNRANISIGAGVEDITIAGTRAASGQQNAVMFYDRVDAIYMNNVDISYFPGYAISSGTRKNQVQAYIRESRFTNIQISASGTASVPAVLFSTDCTASCGSSDASNEINIENVSIYGAPADTLVFSNYLTTNTLRQIRISKLRIEGNEGASGTGNLLSIGDGVATGGITNIVCTDCELMSPYTGYFALLTQTGSGGTQPSYIKYSGIIVQGANGGGGINVQAGHHMQFQMAQLATAATNVTVASTATTGGAIVIDGYGAEQYWTYNIDLTAAQNVFHKGTLGWGSGSKQGVAAHIADSGTIGGNARGAYSVDLQQTRFANTQVASGVGAVIGGGESNTSQQQDCTVAGGAQNVCAGFRSSIGGGFGGQITSQYSAITGGNQALVSNDATVCFSGGAFTTAGDAQVCRAILRQTGTTAQRMTALSFTANTTNTLNLFNNTAALFDIDIVCRESVGTATWSASKVLLTRGVGAATVALSSGTLTAGPTTGSPTSTVPTMAADTTLGGLSLTTGTSANVAHCVANIKYTQVI